MRWIWSALWCCLWSLAACLSSSGSRVLVVIEEAAEKSKYSKFWTDLESRGYHLSFESPKNDKLSLFQHGELAYDQLILLPPKSKAYGPALTPQILLQYVKQEGNVLLTLGTENQTPSAVASLLLELDIHLAPDRNSLVVDHFNYDVSSASQDHDVLVVPRTSPSRPAVRDFFSGSGVVAFPRSVAQELGDTSPLLTKILAASSTAYSYNPKDDAAAAEEPFAVGEQIALVSAVQARNSARFTVFGSVEALEDKWFDGKVKSLGGKSVPTANRDFARQVSSWTFREVGVLKVGRVDHHLTSFDGTTTSENSTQVGYLNPTIYRIKNDVTFNIEISEYSVDRLVPLQIHADDALQLEFTMLSPYHRLDLKPTSQTTNSTIFSTSFKLPDQHGIFSFRVNYKRPFLTNIDVKREVTVRHFAHDEWPRSWEISAGWVWIAGIWITVFGWVGFVGIWLYSEPAYEAPKGKKTQ